MAFGEVARQVCFTQAAYMLTYDFSVNVSFKELFEYLELKRLFAWIKEDISVRKQIESIFRVFQGLLEIKMICSIFKSE